MPLKIKIFMWYLKRGVILTKDNLVRWNWNGSKHCCFCSSDETIQHLFIDCHVAKFLWRAVQFAFDLHPPQTITNLFGNWLRGVGTKLKRQLLVGASALCLAIWFSRNNVVLINLQLTLICRYYIGVTIGSDSGHGYKGVMKIRRQFRRHVKPWRF